MDLDVSQTTGGCHCGAVKFTVKLTNGLHTARRCNCSFCRMRGAVAVSADPGGIEITQGEDKLTLYQFNTKTAKHYFCSVCGIYTFHIRRSVAGQYGVNVACLEGVSPYDFHDVPLMDGVHHASDGFASRQLGTLRFVPD